MDLDVAMPNVIRNHVDAVVEEIEDLKAKSKRNPDLEGVWKFPVSGRFKNAAGYAMLLHTQSVLLFS